MVNVKLDGEKIHAQFVKLKKPELMAQQFLVFEIAPDPDKMTAYDDPDREYGIVHRDPAAGAERAHPPPRRNSGRDQHTMDFDVTYFGTIWSAGSFTIEGDDFPKLRRRCTSRLPKASPRP